jgi:hypothetical protein
MNNGHSSIAASDSKKTLIFILIPMLITFLVLRLYLHLINPNTDMYVAGYNVHHLFTGTLIEITAAFILAFGVQKRIFRQFTLMALGVGSAMVLDEVIYLITTDGTNVSYLTPISLWGAASLICFAGLLLIIRSIVAYRCCASDKHA